MARADFVHDDDEHFLELLERHAPLVLEVAMPFAVDFDHARALFRVIWTKAYDEGLTEADAGSVPERLRHLAMEVCANDAALRAAAST